METPPSGPYRSHLLTLLRRQLLRWQTRSQVALRQVRAAGVWSLQVLWQSAARLWGGKHPSRRLGGREAETTPVDIDRILATLRHELETEPPVRAIACDCQSRKLVAIATDNRIVVVPASLQNRLAASVGVPQKNRLLQLWAGTRRAAARGLARSNGETTGGIWGNLWSPSTPEAPFSLAALIQGAIAYFFGLRSAPRLTEGERTPAAIEPSGFGAWLSYEDLFPSELPPSNATSTAAALPASPTLGSDLEFFPVATEPAGHLDSAAMANEPECLEVRAVTQGYIRHPLEIVIGWLDGLLCWLESRAAALWQGTRRLVEFRRRDR